MTTRTETLRVAVDGRRAQQGTQRVEHAFQRMGRQLRETDQKLRKTQREMNKTGKAGFGLGKTLAALGASFSGLLIVTQVTRTVSEFGVTMATIQGVMRATESDMVALTAAAREMGATTRFSAKEAGDALLFLGRAGFEVNDAIEALPGVLSLATAGAIDLGSAADIASNVLAQFGLEAAQVSQVGDILVNTANSANTNITQLAEALKFAGPVAGALGISLEETAAAAGVLGDSGVQASLAGTNLRGIMAGLLGPTSAAQDAIEGLGLTMEELDPSANSILEVFTRLRDANLSAAEAVDIFGRRNAGAALILTRSTEKLEELTQANKDNRGEAERNARIMQDTLGGAFKNLRSAIEEAQLQAGDAGFTGALRTMIDTMTGGLRIVLGIADATTKANDAFQSAAFAIRALTVAITAFAVSKGVSLIVSLGSTGSPLGAFAALLGVTAAAALTVSDSLGEVGSSAERASIEVEHLGSTVEGLVSAQLELQRALQFGTQQEAVAALERQVTSLEQAIVSVQEISGRVAIGDATRLAGDDVLDRILLRRRQDAARANQGVFTPPIPQSLDDPVFELRGFSRSAPISDADREGVEARELLEILREDLQLRKERIEAIRNGTEAVGDAAAAAVEEELRIADQKKTLQGIIDALEKERDLAIAGGRDREALLRTRRAEALASKLDEDQRTAAIAVLEEELEKVEKARRAAEIFQQTILTGVGILENATFARQRAAAAILDQANATRELERAARSEQSAATPFSSAIGPGAFDRERLTQARQLIEDLRTEIRLRHLNNEELQRFFQIRNTGASATEARQITALLEEADELQRMRDLSEGIAAALGNGSAEFLANIDSGREVLQRLLLDLQRIALQTFVAQPVQSGLSGFLQGIVGSAKGNVFSGGNVIPFQKGGAFVNGPIAFPLGNGKTGVAGEAGPEAILPLERDAEGRLGVVTSGGGARTVNMTVVTQDSNSFRRAGRQIESDLQRIAR